MAKEIAIQMTIDTSDAGRQLEKIDEELKKIDKDVSNLSQKDLALTNKIAALDAEVESGTLSMRQMSKSIMEYQSVALAAGRESPIGKQALAQAANLQDKMVDLRNETTRLAHDGKNMQAALQLGSGVVAGYGAFQSVQAALGVENEQLQQTFIKLQAAQTALISIEQLRVAVEKESFLMLKLNDMWTKANAVSSYLLAGARTTEAGATVVATTATKALTIAMAATGIGLLIVGISLLIANFDKVSEAIGNAIDYVVSLSDKFQEMGTTAKIIIGYFTFGLVPAISYLIEKTKEWGIVETKEEKERKIRNEAAIAQRKIELQKKIDLIEAEKEALVSLTNELTDQLDFEIAKRSAAGEDFADLEEEKIKMLTASAIKQIELINTMIEARRKEAEADDSFFQFDAAKQKVKIKLLEEEVQAQEETYKKLTQSLELFHIKQEKIEKDARTKRKKATKEETKEVEEDLVDHYAELQKIRQEQTALMQELTFSEFDLELLKLQEQYDKKIELAKGNDELMLLVMRKYKEDVAALDNEFETNENEELEKQRQLDKDEAQAIVDAKWDEVNGKIEAVETYTNVASSLAGSLADFSNNIGDKSEKEQEKRAKRQFLVQKILGITEASIDTSKGVIKAVASGNLPFAAIVAASGAAQIAAIASQQFNVSGGASGSSTPTVPTFANSVSGGFDGGSNGTQTTDTDTPLNTAQGGNQSVLVVADFNRVNDQNNKINAISTI